MLGRMLSPDNYVSNATFTQDYNRYSYARNNPLMYTDPDGNNPLIGALIGGVSYTLGVAFSKGRFKNWDWFGFASSVVVGAMTSGFASESGAGLSAASNISAVGKAAIQVGAYSAWGGTTSFMTGGSFVSGAISGGAGSLAGSIFGGLKPGWQIGASALAGGIGAELSGGDFWRGAATSGMVAGFNHAAHILDERAAMKLKKANFSRWALNLE